MSREREYETHVSEQVLRLLRPGSVFVNVGASIGYFTILAARAVGPEGKVIACEPGPQNHTVLLLNTVVNKVGNVLIVPCAISDATTVVAYRHLGGGNGAIAGFDGAPESFGTGDLVQARTLDDILEGQPRIDVIKIDVEGAEGRGGLGGGRGGAGGGPPPPPPPPAPPPGGPPPHPPQKIGGGGGGGGGPR